MGRSLIISSVKQKLLVLTLVFQLAHTAVYICPPTCKCMFQYKEFEKNLASCNTGNSTVNIALGYYNELPALMMACEGTNYNCSDMPQFDVKVRPKLMIINSCSSSILRCASNFLRELIIDKVYLTDSMGPYTDEDITVLNKLWVRKLLIREAEDSVSRLPASAFSNVNTLNSLELGGIIFEYTHITADLFKGLTLLKYLRLIDNNLESIDPDAFSNLVNLKNLTIERNMLQFLPNKLFSKLESFNQINILDNLVDMTLDTHAFADLAQLEIIHVDNSKITKLPNDVFIGSKSLKKITFLNSSIEELPSKIFWTTTSITEMDFRYNQIKDFPVGIFSKLNMLQEVDFSYNNIETINRDLFTSNSMLEEVNLDNNNIIQLDMDVFKKTQLITLSIASNKLERVVGQPSSSWKLVMLILNDNNLIELNEFEDWLATLTDLQYLDLSYNQINKIKESFIYTGSSIEIDLRNNNISNIEKATTELPQSLTINRNISVYLSNNSMECDCIHNIIIKSWYDHGWVPDFEDIVCTNGEHLLKIDVYQECNKDYEFVASVGKKVIGGLVLIIIFISLCTRRKKIWKYVTGLCKRDTNNSITNEERQEVIKQYDIFISFAHQDGEFVTDKLLPKLEYEYGQKVCVHYRDWIVGELIPDQIIQSVENSSKTIIILSKHFLISEWSRLEFRTAYNLSEQGGKSSVIVIILDETILEDENFDRVLKSYIALNTYLLWSDLNFWKKLKKLLPKPRNRSRSRQNIRSSSVL